MAVPRLYITGEINANQVKKASKFLRKVRDMGKETSVVDIILNSEGGNTYDAFAIYDLIRQSVDRGMTVGVVGTGLIASAATLILVAGSYRVMSQNAWVMVHEDTPAVDDAKVTQVEIVAKHYRDMENQWNHLLEKHTKLKADEWTEINKRDTYLTAQQCLEYGLIDEII